MKMGKTVRRVLCGFVAGLLVANSAQSGDKLQLTQDDGKTAQLVASMVTNRHINHPEINDDLSSRLLDRYIEVWDPQKLYFLQSDIDEFNTERTSLDDKILRGDVKFAVDVFDRFRLRMKERESAIGNQIDTEHDFTVDESMERDAKETAWAKDAAELDERWRKRIKFELLMLRLDDVELAEARKRLHTRYHTNEVFLAQTEAHELLELYLSSLTHTLDPHSSYMSPQSVEDFQMDMRLELEGIGARLKYEDGYTIVEEILKGGAADLDGRLKKGDKIIGVSTDAVVDYVDVVEMKLTRVVQLIRGKKGTQVKLQVQKDDGSVQDYELSRTSVKITEDEVKGKIIESGEWIDGRKAKVGIMRIPSFYRDFGGVTAGGEFKSAARDAKVVLEQFRKEQVDVLVVDLRWNGGGALDEAIEVSGLFIPRGSVVQVREPGDNVDVREDEDPEVFWRKPMVVVCNRYSASASEIFAGAIKDYRRGIVVGDKTTYGKGTVQNVEPVASRLSSLMSSRNRGALKLTIQRFYRVNGDSTQARGVPSDITLPSLLNHRDVGEDSMDNAMEFDRITRAEYVPFPAIVTDNIVTQLRKRSETRVADDQDFQQISKLIEKYLERKNDKTISLNEATLRAEEEELKQEQKEEEEAVKQVNGLSADEDIFPNDFYNKELLNITVDYLEMTRTVSAAKKG